MSTHSKLAIRQSLRLLVPSGEGSFCRRLAGAVLLTVTVGIAGCGRGNASSSSDAQPNNDTGERGCAPGATTSCSCPGSEGEQVCQSDRSWGACDCDSSSADAMGSDGHASSDAGTDADNSSTAPDWSHPGDAERTLVARRGATGLAVDGKLDEARYDRADRVTIGGSGDDGANTTSVRAIWNDQALYLGFSVEDGEVETPEERDIWKRDSVQLFVDREHDGGGELQPDDFVFVVDAEGRTRIRRGTGGGRTTVSTEVEAATLATAAGYQVEMTIPWSDLGASPAVGERLGIMFVNHDRAGERYASQAWGGTESFTEPANWGELRLGPPDADDDPKVDDDDGETEDPNNPKCEPENFETIEVAAGERRVIRIGPGETFANKLIDISAPRSHVKILTQGSGWTVRDIGIKGENTNRQGTYGTLYLRATDGGEGLAENIYMGDGGADRVGHAAVSDWDNSGTVTIRNIHVAGWPADGMYMSHAGANPDTQGGAVQIENAYLKNNNIENVRLGGLGSYCQNCVIHVEGRNAVSSNQSDQKNPRGLWFKEQSGNKCIDCDIKVQGADAVFASDEGSGTLIDSRVEGSIRGPVDEQNVSGNPDLTPPEDVPMSAEEAASGC